MTAAAETRANATTVQVHRVFIKAPAQKVWDAITTPEWLEKYGYACRAEFDLRPGGAYKAFSNPPMRALGTPDVIIVGEVIEADPPKKLVQTWHPIWDPIAAAETPTRLTHEIKEQPEGICRVTIIHDVTGAPSVAAMVSGEIEQAGGGWSFILSDLKTLLETGSSFTTFGK
jgi:uncharacterized protein YndB with AHSA1/START domain